VDELVVFHSLEKEHLMSIIDLLVDELNKQLMEHELFIELDREVKEWIIEKYYQPTYGARPMRRAIQKEIEDPLSEYLLKGQFKSVHKIKVTLGANMPVFAEADDAAVLSGVN
jgi:ATP-dependent Clp protease ATP-binding subunit ClpC